MGICYCGCELREERVYYSSKVNLVCPKCNRQYILPGVPALATPFPPYDTPVTGGESFGVCCFPKKCISILTGKIASLVESNGENYLPFSSGLLYSELDSEYIALFFSYAWGRCEVYDYIFTSHEGKSITGEKIEVLAGFWPGVEYKPFPKTLHRFYQTHDFNLLNYYTIDKIRLEKSECYNGDVFKISRMLLLPDSTRFFLLDMNSKISMMIEYVPGEKPADFYSGMQCLSSPVHFYESQYFPKRRFSPGLSLT